MAEAGSVWLGVTDGAVKSDQLSPLQSKLGGLPVSSLLKYISLCVNSKVDKITLLYCPCISDGMVQGCFQGI